MRCACRPALNPPPTPPCRACGSGSPAVLQGSGWGWLGYNKATHKLEVVTLPNQDPLSVTVRPRGCVWVCGWAGVG